ncbi:MAG: reverse transcriptase domain-containing protein [Shimia sp.]
MTLHAILHPARLDAAFTRILARGGAAGSDGIDPSFFELRREAALRELARDVRRGTYLPGPLRRVALRKPDGQVRILRIPCVRDRVLQGAASAVLSARLDPGMSRGSYGYRRGRSVAMALADLRRAHGWALDADIRAFFDEVAHGPLRKELRRQVPCPATRRLIDLWLAGFGAKGLAQGAPISPVLANLALARFDKAMAPHGRLIRYADDFVLVCPSRAKAQAARRAAEGVLGQAGLVLHPRKTRIVPPGTPFNYLGDTVVLRPRGGGRRKALNKRHNFDREGYEAALERPKQGLFRKGWIFVWNMLTKT